MKNMLIVAAIVLFSCNSEKSTSTTSADSTSVGTGEIKSATPTKNIILNNPPSDTEVNKADIVVADANTKKNEKSTDKPKANDKNKVVRPLPSCVRIMIDKFKSEEVQNPPRKIFSYTYKGKNVFYVPALCCDFYSDLYDDNCKLIAHPDGGFTGKGDGSAPDFIKTRSNERLIWEDLRRTR